MRVMGLPVHLWSRKIPEKIEDACGSFLAVNEDKDMLAKMGEGSCKVGEVRTPENS